MVLVARVVMLILGKTVTGSPATVEVKPDVDTYVLPSPATVDTRDRVEA
jgi:hypothetical protein